MLNTFDVETVQPLGHGGNCFGAGWRMGAELGNHRVIPDRNFTAFEHAGIIAERHAIFYLFRRRTIFHQTSRGRQEIPVRVFGVNAAFNGPAIEFHIRLPQGQFFSGRHADHLFHQVYACHKFSNGMLHLQAGVHFEKKERAVLTRHKFHRASAVVVHGFCQRYRLLAHEFPCLGIKEWRWRFLHHFLIAALNGAFALAQVNYVTVLVAQHLNFDVARVHDKFLDEDPVVAKAGFGFGFGPGITIAYFRS